METSESILKKAIKLKPQERYLLIEELIQSLDKPDKEINNTWAEEAVKRLKQYREGKTKGIPYKDIFDETIS